MIVRYTSPLKSQTPHPFQLLSKIKTIHPYHDEDCTLNDNSQNTWEAIMTRIFKTRHFKSFCDSKTFYTVIDGEPNSPGVTRKT